MPRPRSGAIFVPLNFRAKADELGYMINQCGGENPFCGKQISGFGEMQIHASIAHG